jgi:hypothetical protein
LLPLAWDILAKYPEKQSCKMQFAFPQFTTSDTEEISQDDKIKKEA